MSDKTLLYSQREITAMVTKIAREIRKDIPKDEPVVIMTVLDGGMFFSVDVLRELQEYRNIIVDTIGVKSYKGMQRGKLQILKQPRYQLNDRHVIVLDEFIDSGITMSEIHALVKDYEPKSVKVGALLAKRTAQIIPDYVGEFVHPKHYDKWLSGYGLDSEGTLRHLKSIYIQDANCKANS